MNKLITTGLISLALVAGLSAGQFKKNTKEYIDNDSRLGAALVALNGVNINPDHKGWSIGVGAGYDDYTENYGGAIGVGYGFDRASTSGYDIGVVLKAYDTEGGNTGTAIGVTVGF